MGELAGNPGSMRVWQLPQVRELDRKTAALSSRAAATPPGEGVARENRGAFFSGRCNSPM